MRLPYRRRRGVFARRLPPLGTQTLCGAFVENIARKIQEDFCGVKGIIWVNVDVETSSVKYALDEWASEYDVFCKLNEICEAQGVDLDFGEEIEDVAVEETKTEEVL